MVTLVGAMSTAEIGKIFAEMIRQDKVQIISCTGANLEEDIMNLVAHSHYERVPNYRDLTQNKNGIYLKEVKSSNRYLYPEHEVPSFAKTHLQNLERRR
jgi:deoxyhypusine synthase